MIHKYVKLGLAIASFAFGIYLFWDRQSGNGTLVILLSLIIFFLYFRNEFIMIAFFALRKQNMEKAKKWLDKIKYPESRLIKSQQAYYYFLNGTIEMQTNMTKGENLFKKALKTGLLMDHDKAMAKLNLATVAMTKGRKREGNKLLNEAKTLDKRGMLTDQIKAIKGQMKKSQISRNPQMQRMQRKGRII